MTLRKITIDNSVRYIPKSEQTRENKPNITKNKKQSKQVQPISVGGHPNTRKQNKIFWKKKLVEKFAAGVFGILQWIMNCYF